MIQSVDFGLERNEVSMETHHRSAESISGNDFNSRLQSLLARNKELEQNLLEAEKTCQEYKAKNEAQHNFILEMMETIDTNLNEKLCLLLTKNSTLPYDDDDPRSSEKKDSIKKDKICIVPTKTVRRVSNLSDEVKRIKSHCKPTAELSSRNCEKEVNESDHNEDHVDFVNVSRCHNKDDYIPCLSDSFSSSSSQTHVSEQRQETMRLEEEILHTRSKCNSLERSLATLKRKSAERELRSMKSLKNMRQQIENLEEERRRRLDLQVKAEERALDLEIELQQLKEEKTRQLQHEGIESLANSDAIDTKQIELSPSVKREIDNCRQRAMMRNHVDNGSSLPILLVVNEESDSSECDENDDSFHSCIDGTIAFDSNEFS